MLVQRQHGFYSHALFPPVACRILPAAMRRSACLLALAGLAGMMFFWLIDPRWGVARLWGRPDYLIDAAHDAAAGTAVGIIGSAAVLGIGLWLMTRRTI